MDFIDLKKQQERIKPDLDRRIARVLEHGQYVMGPEVYELEEKLCELTSAKYCITCSSGTDALVLPLMAYELEKNDVVFVPSFTFAATAEAVVLAGGIPFFVDVDVKSFNICPNSLMLGISEAQKQGYNIRGVIAVGLFGNPPPFDELNPICEEHNLFLIDDAAQSLGSSYKGQMTGSIADVTATSFFPSKPLGCYGDGGAIFTNDYGISETLKSLRIHGAGKTKYDNVRVGMNARLDSVQAAVLLSKLAVFKDELSARAELARRYVSALPTELIVQSVEKGSLSAWAQFSVILEGRGRVIEKMKKTKVPYQVYYEKPLDMLPAYSLFPKVTSMINCVFLSTSILSIPFHPYLAAEDVDKIVSGFDG